MSSGRRRRSYGAVDAAEDAGSSAKMDKSGGPGAVSKGGRRGISASDGDHDIREEGRPLLLEDDGSIAFSRNRVRFSTSRSATARILDLLPGIHSGGAEGGGGHQLSSSDFASEGLLRADGDVGAARFQRRQSNEVLLDGVPFAFSDTSDDDDDYPIDRLVAQEMKESSLSNVDTIIHLLKGNIGTGILAMPDAIKNSGLLFGNVGLVFMACICVHSMHVLVKCAHELHQRTPRSGKLTYPQVAEKAFIHGAGGTERGRRWSGTARTVINIFLCITQLGFCCVYFVFCAKNIKLVMDHHFGHLDYHAYMGMILLPMLALCSISDLKYLSPFSMLANVLQMCGLGLIFFYLLQDLPQTWQRKMFATWGQLPLYFGTAIYAFEGIGVVLPLENKMQEPRALRGWNGVLNTAMVCVSCLYIAVGFFGYLKYGEAVEASITLNLPVEQWLAQIIIMMFTAAIFFSYALQFYVPIEILLPHLQARFPHGNQTLLNYGLRYSVVLLTFGLAAAIPRLDLFISLVGAASSSTLALMAPAVIDTVLFWPRTGRYHLRLLKNAVLFSIGFFGFLTGSYVSLKNIITYFITGK